MADIIQLLADPDIAHRSRLQTIPLFWQDDLSFANRPGVYYLLNKQSEVIYVGMSSSVLERMKYHRRANQDHSCSSGIGGWSSFAYIPTRKTTAAALEWMEILRLEPLHNREYLGHDPARTLRQIQSRSESISSMFSIPSVSSVRACIENWIQLGHPLVPPMPQKGSGGRTGKRMTNRKRVAQCTSTSPAP